MKVFCLFALLIVAFAVASQEERPALCPKMIAAINSNPKR
jgi:hypothetical protein